MSEPRIGPGGRGEIGVFPLVFSRIAGKVMRTPQPPNLFTTLGRHPGLFRGWLRFASKLMPGGKLPRRETELVILRVAHLRDCRYEWEHHVKLGKRAKLTREDFDRVVEGPAATGWSDRERTILTAVDELVAGDDISDETWNALRGQLDDRRLIELVMLVGHYEMLATTIGTLRIQPDG